MGEMPGWDALWSLSSLHREGTGYGQEAPTHPQCHQWGLEDEGEMVVSSASKQRAIGSTLHAA